MPNSIDINKFGSIFSPVKEYTVIQKKSVLLFIPMQSQCVELAFFFIRKSIVYNHLKYITY